MRGAKHSAVSALLFAITCAHVMKPCFPSPLKWNLNALANDKWYPLATSTNKPNLPQTPSDRLREFQHQIAQDMAKSINLGEAYGSFKEVVDYYASLQHAGNQTELPEAKDFDAIPFIQKREEYSPGKFGHSLIPEDGRNSLFRRSALDKNFIRFGRSDREKTIPEAFQQEYDNDGSDYEVITTDEPLHFDRSQRSLTSNFLRFGRSFYPHFFDEDRKLRAKFLRPGRSLTSNFLRFGRASST